MTQNEFIVPLRPELKEIYAQEEMGNSMSATHTESVRPLMTMSDIRYIDQREYTSFLDLTEEELFFGRIQSKELSYN